MSLHSSACSDVAATKVRSLPPCGGGVGKGGPSTQTFRGAPPSLTLPRKGEGNGESSRARATNGNRGESGNSSGIRTALLVPRLQIALAVIAALRPPRRARAIVLR